MSDDQRLRDLFAAQPSPGGIDARAVIRRSRARRLPRQLAAGAVGALAVVGVGVLGVQSLAPPQPTTITMEQGGGAPAEEFAADSTVERAPAEKLNPCEGALAEVAPSRYGLQLDVVFPESAPATGAPVAGLVRLTNTSGSRVVGTTGDAPAITVSQGGIVLWHSTGAAGAAAVVVDLAAEESLEFAASFTPVRCGAEDDTAEAFRADLPPLAPGVYELTAAIDFAPDPSIAAEDAELDLVTGVAAPIRLE
ncbi:MAG: hypothetical protein WA006_09815 [Rhodoglobus sp.]